MILPAGVLAVTEPAGPSARSIAGLWWFMLAFGAFTFVLVLVALAFGIRRRHDGVDDDGPPPLVPPPESVSAKRWMMFGGIVLPSVAIVGVFAGTLIVLRDTDPRRTTESMTIEVTGHQWWWEVTYPNEGVVTANEVHIPAGEPILIQLQSDDVIHSFWVPELAGKMDALPDRPNSLLIEADQPGRYEGKCAEFCGLQHAFMGITVVAHDRADYDAWVAANNASISAASSSATAESVTDGGASDDGATVFAQNCARCHTLDGSEPADIPAPNLATLWSREEIGGVLPNTSENVRDWIADPHAYKEGALMPEIDLTDDQLDEVVAYIEGLQP